MPFSPITPACGENTPQWISTDVPITPACGGNTFTNEDFSPLVTDNPRTRGEY
uniref:Uncharacterized protein n=1 Tax=Klebsiella pneumoniae TaxID=573 RepID=A0A8E6L8W4_KLEPN|nr:hypothetical protein [Klebsiella pneumoniae]